MLPRHRGVEKSEKEWTCDKHVRQDRKALTDINRQPTNFLIHHTLMYNPICSII